jgi:hypothetical protein
MDKHISPAILESRKLESKRNWQSICAFREIRCFTCSPSRYGDTAYDQQLTQALVEDQALLMGWYITGLGHHSCALLILGRLSSYRQTR